MVEETSDKQCDVRQEEVYDGEGIKVEVCLTLIRRGEAMCDHRGCFSETLAHFMVTLRRFAPKV